MNRRNELIRDLNHWFWAERIWIDEIADKLLARDQKILDEIEKPLKIYIDQMESGYGLTTMGSVEVIKKTYSIIQQLRGE